MEKETKRERNEEEMGKKRGFCGFNHGTLYVAAKDKSCRYKPLINGTTPFQLRSFLGIAYS